MTQQKLTETKIPKLLSIKELALRLSLSERQIRRLITNHKIFAPIRIGGSLRFFEQECIDWLSAGAPDRKTWEVQRQQATAQY